MILQGTVFSIEEFSVFDGPGIRTTVFLKGCPLKCSWCHNPEGQIISPQIVRSPNGCLECGNCFKFADFENGVASFTQKSIDNCPAGLLRTCGEITDSSNLCEKLLKNQALLKNGGVTFSGGEPFAQSEFLFSCLENLKGKINTAVQTSGYCDENTFKKALILADYFLFDLKIIDSGDHLKFTGVKNDKILNNFKLLTKSGKDFVVRIPLIPTVTDTEKNINAIAKLLKETGVNYAELLPYNKMAGGKYKMLGREYSPNFDESVEVNIHKEIFDLNNITIKVL